MLADNACPELSLVKVIKDVPLVTTIVSWPDWLLPAVECVLLCERDIFPGHPTPGTATSWAQASKAKYTREFLFLRARSVWFFLVIQSHLCMTFHSFEEQYLHCFRYWAIVQVYILPKYLKENLQQLCIQKSKSRYFWVYSCTHCCKLLSGISYIHKIQKWLSYICFQYPDNQKWDRPYSH